jgi:hypothetical protein
MPGTRSRGQALVEFALIAPVLFLVLFAIFDVGRLIYVYNNLANSTRQAARAGIVAQYTDPICYSGTTYVGRDPCVQAVAHAQAVAVPNPTFTPSCTGSCAPGDVYSVTGSSSVTFLTPVVSQLLGPITVTATTQMGVES